MVHNWLEMNVGAIAVALLGARAVGMVALIFLSVVSAVLPLFLATLFQIHSSTTRFVRELALSLRIVKRNVSSL